MKKIWSALAFALVVSLTACGGGGGDDEADNGGSDNAGPVDVTQVAAISQYCGITLPVVPAGNTGTFNLLTSQIDSKFLGSSSAIAVSGFGFSGDQSIGLVSTLYDYRGMSSGVYTKPAIFRQGARMGAYFYNSFGNQAMGCVRPLTQWASSGPNTISWKNREGTAVPLSTLPGYAIDGFELVANFTPDSGTVLFAVPKDFASHSDALSICKWVPGSVGSAWTCSKPSVTTSGDNWVATISGASAGSYVLASTYSTRGQ